MKKTVVSVIFSNFIGSGLGFLINVFLARNLTIEAYGRITLIYTFIIVLYSIFEFNFGNTSVVFYGRLKKYFKNEPEKILFFINKIFINVLPYSLFLLFISLWLIKIFYHLNNFELAIVFINFYMFLLYRYLIALHQALGNWKVYNRLNVLNNLAKSIVLVLCFFFLGKLIDNYNKFLFGYAIFPFIVLIISIFYSTKQLKSNNLFQSKRYLKIFKNIIFPLGISNIFIVISMRIDNLIIEKYLGSKELGIYATANVLALMFPLITAALRNVFLHESSSQSADFLKNILFYQKKYIYVILGVLVMAVLLAKPMFWILYGERYMDAIPIFQILLIAYVGGIYFTPLESYFYSHSPNKIRNLKFVQMLIIVFAILILVSPFRLYGVAIAILVSRVYGWIYLNYQTYLFKKLNYSNSKS